MAYYLWEFHTQDNEFKMGIVEAYNEEQAKARIWRCGWYHSKIIPIENLINKDHLFLLNGQHGIKKTYFDY